VSRGGHSSAVADLDLVVMVASLGGLAAVITVLAALPESFPAPIALAQHRVPGSDDRAYAELLRRKTGLPVRIAEDASGLCLPGVTLIPAGQTATVDSDLRFRIDQVRRPGPDFSGDALFASAAESTRGALVGVVLTGKLQDGSEGVRAIKRSGGVVLVQEPAGARAAEMPRSAIATGCVDHVLPLEKIPAALTALVMAPGAADLFAVPAPAWAQFSRS
jgi:two-component system chemotaxis response regulator CheB